MDKLDFQINQAAQLINTGAVIAFPTDTFYGLGCDPFNANSVEKIYKIKQRQSDKAILLLVSSLDMLDKCVDWEQINSNSKKTLHLLTENFWPGPLTIILPAKNTLPSNLVSPAKTIGIRYPNYLIAQKLTQAIGGVITATSANLSGQANTQTAAEVIAQLGNTVDYILDGGKSPGGSASTIIDISCEPPRLVREGAISREKLKFFLDSLQ